ncbi:hypothetical protein [Muricoccus radiodurans]|uniref:hypothetical protein n=1 Tax=Muricoccus radiodurans TaxID=2231721 RepID=UPI003CEA5607
MRIVWVGKEPEPGGRAGDEVFDNRSIAALRQLGHEVERLHPRRVSRLREMANLVLGVPHYRSWYADRGNQARVEAAARDADALVISWEPLDVLRAPPGTAALLILHNVTSQSLPALFPGSRIPALLASFAGRWERRRYRADEAKAVAALSRRDMAFLAAIPGVAPVVLTLPGMPPLEPLAEDAVLVRELVVSGTYDWTPKRRDLLQFLREYRSVADRVPVLGDGWPPEAEAILRPQPLPAGDISREIRFGIVSDRFEAGHKLKTGAYIAANQIVLSFSDAGHDFEGIPDRDLFIRRVAHASDIGGHIASVASIPPDELRDRLRLFKQRCAERFRWSGVAETIAQVLEAQLAEAGRISSAGSSKPA